MAPMLRTVMPVMITASSRPNILPRLLLDSRVVDLTMAYNPIFATLLLLEALIFQGS